MQHVLPRDKSLLNTFFTNISIALQLMSYLSKILINQMTNLFYLRCVLTLEIVVPITKKFAQPLLLMNVKIEKLLSRIKLVRNHFSISGQFCRRTIAWADDN